MTCCQRKLAISKSKHIVHIYNRWSKKVIKEATRATAETNTLTYYIVNNKKNTVADSGIIPCGIGDHDLVYIIRHARLPKINKDPKIVTVRSTKNLNNDPLIKDLNQLPFELIRSQPTILWSSWKSFFLDIFNKHAPVKTIRVRGNNLPFVMAEVKSMVRQRYYLRGKASKTGSKYLRQAFQH